MIEIKLEFDIPSVVIFVIQRESMLSLMQWFAHLADHPARSSRRHREDLKAPQSESNTQGWITIASDSASSSTKALLMQDLWPQAKYLTSLSLITLTAKWKKRKILRKLHGYYYHFTIISFIKMSWLKRLKWKETKAVQKPWPSIHLPL